MALAPTAAVEVARDPRSGTRRGGGPPRTRRRRQRGEAATGLAFTAPALVVFGLFMFLPLVMTAYYSLTRYTGFGKPRFIGGDNYSEIAADPLFWRALLNTAVFTVISVPLSIAGGLALALLLNRALPARGVLRALFYVPVVISAVVSGIVARWMFNEGFGIVNRALQAVGLPAVPWQTDGTAAMVSLVLVTIWMQLGFVMVIYLAALQGVPGEVYEAASLDGATPWRALRSVTWPLLAPTTFFVLVYLIITSFQVFDIVLVMTGGGPANATTFLVTYAYDEGFQQRRQGYAAALGVVVYVIVLVLTVVQWRVGRRREIA